MWLGDYTEDHTAVVCMFTTHSSTGAPVAPSSGFEAADVRIYKNGNAAEKTTANGVTMTSPFDSITGLHCLTIDTSNDTGDGGFWTAGAVYTLVLSPDETVDSVAVAKVIGQFGIELAGALRPTTAGRKLDVSTGGEAGLDWANIGAPTTTVDLSGTTVKTATDVETDTSDIQSRLPAALVSGRMSSDAVAISGSTTAADNVEVVFATDFATNYNTTRDKWQVEADVIAMSGDNTAADNLESAFDGTGGVTITAALTGNITGNLSGSVGSVAGDISGNLTGSIGSIASGGITSASFAADAITATAIASDAIGAVELASDAVAEIQAGLSTLDAAGVRAAVGLASANLDTQLDALPTATENADALLDRDMASGTDSGSTTVRTPRQALRFLRNKWSISGSTLTVTKEDDSNTSWSSALTQTAGADPITASDPAGP